MLRCRRRPSLAFLGAVLLLLVALLSSPADARKRDASFAADDSGQCDCEPSITAAVAAVEESKTQLVATHQTTLADVQAKLESAATKLEAAAAEKDAAAAEKDAALASLQAELEAVRAQLETSQKAAEEAEAMATPAAEAARAAKASASACRLELADTVAKQNEAIQSERSVRSLLQQTEAESAKRQSESSRRVQELTKEVDTSRSQIRSMNDRYSEARRELMDVQREARHLHQKLVSKYVNTTLVLEDVAAVTDATVAWGRDVASWAAEAAVAAWHAVRESTDAAMQVIAPVVTELSEEMRTKYGEAKAALAPHGARVVTQIGDGIGPHYRSVRSQVGKAYGDTVQPIVDGTVAPLYREHVAPLLARAGEVVESCRLTAVSGIEQGTTAMMDTISTYDEEVKEESPMRQRALAHLQWTHDHAESCVRTISYWTGGLIGLYLFGGFLWRLAIFVIKVGTSPVWVPFWLIYWIISKAVGGGKKNKGDVATTNGMNGSHASQA
mmetsp:Transcript_5295/g.15038  ORF Transcript_5295/g.15038 Transcript_5295/m.15038 type:complete len:501 (+) Transcript_5295:72-1574(+)